MAKFPLITSLYLFLIIIMSQNETECVSSKKHVIVTMANQFMVPYLLNIEMTHCTGLNELHMTDHSLAWSCMPVMGICNTCYESITK